MHRVEREASNTISIIGGADGPTAVFMAAKESDVIRSLRRRLRTYRRKRAAAKIIADPHTMEEVMQYLVEQHHFHELTKESKKYQRLFSEYKTSMILQYGSHLLGGYAKVPEYSPESEDSLEHFVRFMNKRMEIAEQIPAEVFPMDLHVFVLEKGKNQMEVVFETNHGVISSGAQGKKSFVRGTEKIYRDIILYYGVSEKDIERKSRRYRELLSILVE